MTKGRRNFKLDGRIRQCGLTSPALRVWTLDIFSGWIGKERQIIGVRQKFGRSRRGDNRMATYGLRNVDRGTEKRTEVTTVPDLVGVGVLDLRDGTKGVVG
jgi:hypothetical protein